MNKSHNLLVAVRSGNLKTVRELVVSIGLFYSLDYSNGYILLCEALQRNHMEIAKLLLINGAEVNSENSPGETPLYYAVQCNNEEMVQMLLEKGANSDCQEDHRCAPLYCAISKGFVSIVEILLNHGIDVNSYNSGSFSNSPLHDATSLNNLEMMKLLLRKNAQVNSVSSQKPNVTPLFLAAMKNYKDAVTLLLHHGADVNAECENETVLYVAVKNGHATIVEELLKYNPDISCEKNKNCLKMAVKGCIYNYKNIVTNLLDYGFTINSRDLCEINFLSKAIKDGYLKQLLEKNNMNLNSLHYGVYREIFFDEEIDLCPRNCEALYEQEIGVLPSNCEGYALLHIATFYEDMEVIKYLLSDNADVNVFSQGHCLTPLFIAVRNGYEEIVKLLLFYGANVNIECESKTVLYIAIRKKYETIAKEILKYHPDINSEINRSCLKVAMNNRYFSMTNDIVYDLLDYGFAVNSEDLVDVKFLFNAIFINYFKIVEQFIKLGLNMNKIFNSKGYFPLHYAIISCNYCITMLLLNNGADVNIKDKSGNDSLFYAVRNGDLNIFNLLLARGANIKENPLLLHVAIQSNFVERILDYITDINVCDEYQNTAMHLVIHQRGVTTIRIVKNIKMLMEKGANVDAKNSDGRTPLHLAIKFNNEEIVRLLLEYNVNINVVSQTGESPLHVSVKNRNSVLTQLLLNNGSDVNTKTEGGFTALHLATQYGCADIVEDLLEHNAVVDSKTNAGDTALHIATEKNEYQIIKLLLDFGANINSQCESDITPLHIACMNGHSSIIKLLLDKCADFNIVDKIGEKPLQKVESSKCRFKMVNIIKNHNLIKLIVANLYKGKVNLEFIMDDKDNISFREECELEVARMKSTMISTNISMYDILNGSPNQIASFLKIQSVTDAATNFQVFSAEFPVYATLINHKFKQGMRINLLENCSSLAFLNLPHLCAEYIFFYLDNEDLQNLINAYVLYNPGSPQSRRCPKRQRTL